MRTHARSSLCTIKMTILLAFILSLLSCKLHLATAASASASDTPRTGSWQNCTAIPDANPQKQDHPDSAYTTISCERIHYRIPESSLGRANDPIIIGVLSGAAIKDRRTSIRSTWAYKKRNVFFIVGGPWEDIEVEYREYGDLLWIDREEIYITETSVLTFKTESFLSIMYERIMQANTNIEYIVKADDDSYIHLQMLNRALLKENWGMESLDYWGKCHDEAWKPHRNQVIPWQKKWYISYKTYPEPEYPPYCQGAGIALSKKFLDCAIGKGHAAQIRYMPNEDTAVGMLAERCGIPTMNDDRVWIRWDHDITMKGKIIQHYVKSEKDMRLHHQSATGVKGPIVLL